MTALDVSRLLKVHEETVRRWTRSGKIAAVKLPNNTVRYDPEVVRALVAGQVSA
jgi:excisionase family DNA binding protein